MLFESAEFGKFVWISGFETGSGNLESILWTFEENYPNIGVQLVDLDKVAGSRFLLLATVNALRSFGSKQPISKTLGMEVLLYISGSRQISEAIKLVGITPTTKRIAALVVGTSKEEVNGSAQLITKLLNKESRDQIVDQWSDERLKNVRAVYDIGGLELHTTVRKGEGSAKAVERLATERSALLAIKK